MTVFQRWKRRRDLVVWTAVRRGGLSARFVADAMNLSKSRVCQVVAEVDRLAARHRSGAETDRGS